MIHTRTKVHVKLTRIAVLFSMYIRPFLLFLPAVDTVSVSVGVVVVFVRRLFLLLLAMTMRVLVLVMVQYVGIVGAGLLLVLLGK